MNRTYYQRNREVVSNKAKDHYENHKEKLRKEEEKIKKIEYGKNRYHNA